MPALDRVMSLLPAVVRKAFEDETVSELMINGPGKYFVERDGAQPVEVEAPGLTAEDVYAAAIHIARPLGLEAGEKVPIVDARLDDGSRVAIALPPVVQHAAITIRRFGGRQFSAKVSSDNYSCRWRQLELPVVLRKLEGGRGSPKGDQCSPRIVAEGGGSRGKRSLPLSGRARQSAVREGPGGEPPGPEFGAVGRLLFWRSCDRHSGESARAVEPPRLEALLEALHGYLFSLASPWRRRACSAR